MICNPNPAVAGTELFRNYLRSLSAFVLPMASLVMARFFEGIKSVCTGIMPQKVSGALPAAALGRLGPPQVKYLLLLVAHCHQAGNVASGWRWKHNCVETKISILAGDTRRDANQ